MFCKSLMTRHENKKHCIFFVSSPFYDGQVLYCKLSFLFGCLLSVKGITFHPISSLRRCSRVVSRIEIKENKF